MKAEFGRMTDRELLILIAEKQAQQEEETKEIKKLVVKHEKFKNTLIGAMTTSLIASVTAFFKSIFN